MKLMWKCSVFTLLCFFLAGPLRAADTEGKWSIGIHPGVYKLVMTDHSDMWTPGWLINADVKYGLTPKWSLGVEGSWMKTYLADLSDNPGDGAGASFSKIDGGAQNQGYLVGLLGEYQFSPDGKWSPYVNLGTGMYIWKWTDKDGNTLLSDSADLDVANGGAGDVPDVDNAGNPYELKDQELYVMGGAGMEYFASDLISLGLGVKFRYLTHLFTNFTDDQDIVGTGAGQLDLPRGIVEGLVGITFHFGGGCPEASATVTGDPGTGSVPLDVQFNGAVTGGCPGYTYQWDFGDGVTSDQQNPRHTYTKEGTYTATMTVTDSKGKLATSNMNVTASCPPLQAVASADPAGGNTPLTVKFSAQTTGGCPPFTYNWDFGDSTTSTEQNPTHTYEKDGNMSASLSVSDAKGVTHATPVAVAATSPIVPTPEQPIVLEGVHFQSGKAVLIEESLHILDHVAEVLKAHPDVNVEVGGHTDSDGSDASNLKLSTRRANAVRDYLIKMGVPAAQLTAKGYGETQPIADNKTPEGKAQNRRVELKRL